MKKELKNLAQELRVTDYPDFRAYLKAIFEELRIKNPDYTQKDFSEHLGLGSRNAHQVIQGRRPLTNKAAEKLAATLGLTRETKKFFITSVAHDNAKDAGERDRLYRRLLDVKSRLLPNELARNQLAFFEHWYHAAILEILRLNEAKDDPQWIANEITPKISLGQVRQSLNLLTKLGYIDHNEKRGRLYPTKATITTGNEVRGMAIYSFHQQMMDLAKSAMHEVQPDHREISAVTLSVTTKQREMMKREIADFRKKLIEIAQSGQDETNKPNEVVQINFQMFPLISKDEGKS